MRYKRAAATLASMTAALPIVAFAPSPAGAASSGPAPLPPDLSSLMSVQHMDAMLRARQVSVTTSTYTVRSGDTLSSIAKRVYGAEAKWPKLWWDNHKAIPNPDMITPGMVLTVDPAAAAVTVSRAVVDAAYRALPKPPPPPPTHVVTTAATVDQTPAADPPEQAGPVSTAGDSAFQACVISRESGGNPQVMNSTDHYGLYQFSYSTWVAYGGDPALFGHASAAYQDQIYDNVMSTPMGADNWAPYDGC
jgi:Transglycosylase-like domain/LysM domain